MAGNNEGARFDAMDAYEAISDELDKLRFIQAAIVDGAWAVANTDGAAGGMALIIGGAIDGIRAQAELMRISAGERDE